MLNLSNCKFTKITTYLCKEVGKGQVHLHSAKIDAIIDYPETKTKYQLLCFLGLAGYILL